MGKTRERIYKFFSKLPIVQQIKKAATRIVLPGFQGIPLYDVTVFFYKEVNKNDITTRASSVAFKFFMAIFPAIIFLFTLLPYIPIEDFQAELLKLLKDFLPRDAYELTETTFTDMIENPRGELLSIGFIFTLYLATNGIHGMITSFNYSYHTKEKRSALKHRLLAVILVFILTFLVVTAIVLIVFSNVAINYLAEIGYLKGNFEIFLLQTGQWITILALIFSAISFLYYLGPSKKVRFNFINPGSSLATILSVLTSVGFSYYVNNFGQYNKLYGSLGTIIVIMLWIYFNSLIILVGFELNASIYLAKNAKLEGKVIA